MYQIGNVYVISAIAIMGGGLFGFDISAMSAMWVESLSWRGRSKRAWADRYVVFLVKLTSAISTKPPSTVKDCVLVQMLEPRVVSQLRCRVDPGWELLFLAI